MTHSGTITTSRGLLNGRQLPEFVPLDFSKEPGSLFLVQSHRVVLDQFARRISTSTTRDFLCEPGSAVGVDVNPYSDGMVERSQPKKPIRFSFLRL